MKTRLKRLYSFVTAFVLSFSALAVWAPQTALAAVRTWDGGGSDNNWSTAANWSDDTAPTNGDSIVLPTNTDPEEDRTLNNDIDNLSLSGITVTGSDSGFVITGNPLSLTGDLQGNGDSPYGVLTLEVDLTVSSPLTIADVQSSESLSIGNNAITLGGSISFEGGITGSGAVTLNAGAGGKGGGCSVTSSSSPFAGDSSSFSGAFTVNNGSIIIGTQASSFARNASSITKSADGGLAFTQEFGQNNEFDVPLTLNGGAVYASQLSGDADTCEAASSAVTLTISSDVTLTAETEFYLRQVNLKFTGNVTGSQYVKVHNSSAGEISFGDTTLKPQKFTTEYKDNSPSTFVSVGNNETAVVTGVYGGATVMGGGVLKGTGSLLYVSVSEGGKVAPGMSPGGLTSRETLSLAEGATYELELKNSEEYDQLAVGENFGSVGSAVILGDATLEGIISDGFSISADDTFTIIDNRSDTDVNGTFKDLPEGATFKISDGVFKITYVGGDGNDVVLSVVSVPTVPSSGLRLIFANPIVLLAATIASAGAAYYLARRYSLRKASN